MVQTCQIVKVRWALPVVVLTRFLELRCHLDAMQLGAADYLEKPLPPGELDRVITTHCRVRKRENSGSVS